MLILLSPAKTLNLSPQRQTKKQTEPRFLDDAEILVKKLRGMSKKTLGRLMDISPELAELNHDRYAAWSQPFTTENAKQAILTFDGEVYTGLNAEQFRSGDLAFAQKHLRILSGLYGILRPFDLMQPYRLEMGTKLPTRRGKTLYDFWGERITDAIRDDLSSINSSLMINLASNEYFKAVKPKRLDVCVVAPVFKEIKAGKSRTIATFAKQARGRMAAWLVRERITDPAAILSFSETGYEYVADESTADKPVFARPQPAPPSR